MWLRVLIFNLFEYLISGACFKHVVEKFLNEVLRYMYLRVLLLGQLGLEKTLSTQCNPYHQWAVYDHDCREASSKTKF